MNTIRKVLLAPVRVTVSFWNGMNRLVGDLVLPPWEGPHPLAVFVDGYGPGGRDQGTWPQRLAGAGIASLAYDKPGCGESTGDWSSQTLQDRADEIAMALSSVRAHPAIAGGAVALLGSGQGGWVCLLVAQAGQVAAIVVTSTSAMAAVALEEYRLGRRMTQAGCGPAEVGLAQALLRERVRRLSAGDPPSAVLAAEAAVHHAPWYGLMPGATADEVRFVARLATFDPAAALSALQVPMLALHGSDDIYLPVDENALRLRAILDATGHPDHEIVVVPGADHGLRVHVGPGPARMIDGRYQTSEVAPGVFELIVTWLDRRLGRLDSPLALVRR